MKVQIAEVNQRWRTWYWSI